MSTLFLSNNLGVTDAASYTVTTGTENAQFPLSNFKDNHTTKVFRSTGNTLEFTVDMGSLNTVDTFALVGSSVDGLGITACSIYLSATNDFTGAAELVVALSDAYNFGYKQFTSGSYRYMRISLTGNGSYCELSNFYIGEATEFANNGIEQSSFKYTNTDNSKISKNKYGSKFINSYNRIKVLSGAIKTMNSAEFTTLNNIYTEHGVNTPIWFMADTTEAIITDGDFIFSGYFYFNSQPTFTTRSGLLFDSTFVLEDSV